MSKVQLEKHLPEPPLEGAGINTGVAVIGFILCFLAGSAVMWGYDQHRLKTATIGAEPTSATTRGSAPSAGAWSDEDSPIPVSSKDPMAGRRDAPITIVIYSDFECPFCSRVEPALDQVKTTYGDKVRFIWKSYPLPFHATAKPASEAAQGVFVLAGSDAFWKFHDLAFKNQQGLNQANFEKWAQASGVTDMTKFKAGLASHVWADKVEKDLAGGKQVGVSGTPAFYINGIFLSGAQPFERFKAIIDTELGKAMAKVAAGTPKERVYVVMSQENKKAAPPAAKEEDEEEKEDTKTVWRIPVGDSPVVGNPNAPVTIVVFSDFQCPFCSRVEPTLKALRDKYPDKVRVVWKNEPLPFHPRAEPAAQLALEARDQKRPGDQGFWAAHAKLFEHQKNLDDDSLWKIAAELGLNVEKVKAAVKDHKYKRSIDADQDVAEDFQANGTPHMFINGRRLVGAQPQEKFEKIIEEELRKAGQLAAKGIRPEKLYDELTKDGKGPPEPERKTVALSPTAPWKGAAMAKVVIQEFSDYECPFCGRVEDAVREVLKNYGDKVKFVWRDLPLPMHANAPLAAQAAREAFKQKGLDAFWKMHDRMYSNQKDLKRETLDGYAKELGLDMDKWRVALDTGVHKAGVEADTKAGNDAGISGTPAFVINGYFISGAQPYSKFRKLIERALSEAK
ncbi:MAG: thioredoxin domain-containing protein [Myxococcales bacterium]